MAPSRGWITLYFVAFASYSTTDFWSDLSMWGIYPNFKVGFGTPNFTELPVNKEIAIITDVKTN